MSLKDLIVNGWEPDAGVTALINAAIAAQHVIDDDTYVPIIPGIIADGVTDNYNTIVSWIAANLPHGGRCQISAKGRIATSPLDIPASVHLILPPATDQPVGLGVLTPPRLIPAGPGQEYVVGLVNPSALISGFVDALPNGTPNTAQHAVKVTAPTCGFRGGLTLCGGSVSTLYGAVSAVEFTGDVLHVWPTDSIGGVKPIDWAATDAQVAVTHTSGHGPVQLSGVDGRWGDMHIVTSANPPAGANQPALIDNGGQSFTSLFIDGTPGIAFIDRSAATSPSTYGILDLYQSTPGVVGIPMIKESVMASAGARIVRAQTLGGIAAGSSFTEFMDAPVISTQVQAVQISNAYTTVISAVAPAPGVWANAMIGNGVVAVQSGQVSLTADTATPGGMATILLQTPTLPQGRYILRGSAVLKAATAGGAAILDFALVSGGAIGLTAQEQTQPVTSELAYNIEAIIIVTASAVISLRAHLQASVVGCKASATDWAGAALVCTFLSWRRLVN